MLKFLWALRDFMRLNNLRIIDLVRSSEFNTSSQHAVGARDRGDALLDALKADAGGDVTLDADELFGILSRARFKTSLVECRQVCHYLDLDGNGELDVDELQQAMHWASRLALPEDTLAKAAAHVQAKGHEHPEVQALMQMGSRGLTRHMRGSNAKLQRVKKS